jgi:LPS export ABC transporter protein LptC
MTRSRVAALASLAAVLAAGVLIGRWWDGRPAAPAAPPAAPSASPAPERSGAPDFPFLQIEGTNLSGADPQGRRIWDVKAQTLEVDRDRRRLVMTAVTGQFYAAGRPALAFRAPQAALDVSTRDVELTGGVLVQTTDGRTLRAARLRYTASDGILTASGDVRLVQAGVSISADELRTDAGLRESRFSGNVVVRVTE